MSDRIDTIRTEIEPVLAGLGLEVYDVAFEGGGGRPTLRVTIDREGGVDLDAIERASLALDPVLDASPSLHGPYTLEVSSPGLERPLRRPEHFAGAVGSTVTLKIRDAEGRARRIRGELTEATDAALTVIEDGSPTVVAISAVESARTVFEFGPAPKPGRGSKPGRAKKEVASR